MTFIFLQPEFEHPLYFCPHEGRGFKLSSEEKDGLTARDKREAEEIARKLQEQSGFEVEIKRK